MTARPRGIFRAALLVVAWLAAVGGPVFGESHPNAERGFRPERVYQSGDLDHINLFNGGLTLAVPLGPAYPVRENFSYQLTLAHNSKLWDFKGRPDGSGGTFTIVNPNSASNAGMGWMISFGRLLEPFAVDNPAADAYVYIAPDGSEHRFYSQLHDTDASTPGILYTRDGSYLRLRLGPPVQIEFPDGRFNNFNLKGRANEYRDRFGNGYNVVYGDYTQWTINDTAGRQHFLNFQSKFIDGVATMVLSSADLAGFNGGRSVYTFVYTEMDVPRRGTVQGAVYCLSTDPMQSEIVDQAPMLTEIQLPADAGEPVQKYTFQYYLDDNLSCRFGTVRSMGLPTRGRIDWDYAARPLPSSDCEGLYGEDPYTGSNWPSHTPAVFTRKTFDWTGVDPVDTWTYSASFSPNPDGFAGLTCDFPTTYPSREEEVVTVTDPRGTQTRHYFSVYMSGRTSLAGYNKSDHGLPFSRAMTDPHGRGTFISSETCFDGSCGQKRSAFALHEQDTGSCTIASQLHNCINRNRRVLKETVTYENDPGVFSAVDYADFDGLGNYRHTTLGGNYGAGNVRLKRKQWNPSSGTYPGGFLLTPTNVQWLPELFSFEIDQEGATGAPGTKVVQKSYDFDTATGFLRCMRSHATLGSSTGVAIPLAATDTLVKYTASAQGFPIAEQWFGGDTQSQSVPTSSVCAAPASAKYAYTHGYAAGVRNSTTADLAGGLRLLTLTIDTNTGLPSQSRTRNTTTADGALTTYTYDALGRLRTVVPAGDATTEYRYTNSAGSAPSVEMTVGSIANPARQERWSFDGMGRLVLQQMRLPDASNLLAGGAGFWSYQHTRYAAGSIERQTERTTNGSFAFNLKATVFSDYDALGRARTIKAADDTTTTLTYSGNRRITRQYTIFGASGSATPVETAVTTTEEYDRQGRLYQVTEPGPTTTRYSYDVSHALAKVCQNVNLMNGGCPGQTRLFNYDARGFLTSENHPELGPAGTTYSSFDPRGRFGVRNDGVHALTYSYDGAERLGSIAEAGQVLKQYVYHTTNSGADLRIGQVYKATRTNVVGAPFNTTVKIEENFVYAGGQGRISQKNTIMRLANDTPREQFTQDFGYDTLGRVVSETYPRCTSVCSGDAPRTVTYTYQKGRLFSVPGFVDSTATVPGITYHPSGLAKEIRHSNNTFDVWTADASQMARPGEIRTAAGSPAGTALWRTGAYGYDGSGNIKAMGVDAFRYDSKGRLTQAKLFDGQQGTGVPVPGALQTEDASFDIFGNLTVLTLTPAGGVGITQSIPTNPTNNTNRWHSASYDNAGNMTNVAGVAYEYDAFNNLKRWTASPADHTFVYTAGDERFWEVTPGLVQSSWALRGLDGTIRREYEVAGASFANYTDTIYRERTPVATVGPGGSLHLHTDHLGNLRMATNSAGSQWWYREYFPHGRLATKLSPADSEQHTFTGHERDLNVRIANGCPGGVPCNDWRDNADGDDLDNMHARYYKPQWGRFLGVDPVLNRRRALREPQNWNRYAYALGNPLLLLDPDGRDVIYSDSRDKAFYETAAQRNWRVAAVLNAFGPGSGRDLFVTRGDAGMLGDGKTPLAAVAITITKSGPDTRPGYNDQASLQKAYEAAGGGAAGDQVVISRTELSLVQATIVLGTVASKGDKLHELGHVDQAIRDPATAAIQGEQAKEASKRGPEPYNRSASERYAEDFANKARTKDPDPPY